LNRAVGIKSHGTDRYGRILGVVYVNGINVNIELVQMGLAEVYRGRSAKGLDINSYWNAEAEAKKAGLGMWSLGDKYVSPRDWRKG
jgi:endonuclease YncB( thermonuclease family)